MREYSYSNDTGDAQADLEAIAPVIRLAVDYEKGVVESTKSNTQTIASIFGKEADVDAIFDGFQPRIDTLNSILKGKNVLLGMYNANIMQMSGTPLPEVFRLLIRCLPT